jgi:hypothetical protein
MSGFVEQGGEYLMGIDCTWHDVAAKAGKAKVAGCEMGACCPHCGSPTQGTATEREFWEMVRGLGGESMAVALWSQGKCFHDEPTLMDAYRQAMAGEAA